jgi:hypothetical protein
MYKLLLLTLSAGMLGINFFNTDINSTMYYDGREKYDPALQRLNTIPLLTAHIDSIAAAHQIPTNSYEYVHIVVSVIKYRFYHGFSHFTFSQNWIAALSGKYIEEGLACKVQPADILQHGNAACSQQAIVMMAVLKEKNIAYRKIGFPHHYALEVNINNQWSFFDANMEPNMTEQQRLASHWQYKNDNLKQYYDSDRFTDLDYKFGVGLLAERGPINEVPAAHANFFQQITCWLSKLLWLLPLALLYYVPNITILSKITVVLCKKNSSPSLAA